MKSSIVSSKSDRRLVGVLAAALAVGAAACQSTPRTDTTNTTGAEVNRTDPNAPPPAGDISGSNPTNAAGTPASPSDPIPPPSPYSPLDTTQPNVAQGTAVPGATDQSGTTPQPGAGGLSGMQMSMGRDAGMYASPNGPALPNAVPMDYPPAGSQVPR